MKRAKIVQSTQFCSEVFKILLFFWTKPERILSLKPQWIYADFTFWGAKGCSFLPYIQEKGKLKLKCSNEALFPFQYEVILFKISLSLWQKIRSYLYSIFFSFPRSEIACIHTTVSSKLSRYFALTLPCSEQDVPIWKSSGNVHLWKVPLCQFSKL